MKKGKNRKALVLIAVSILAAIILGVIIVCILTASPPGGPEESDPVIKPVLIVEGTSAKAGDSGVEVLVKIENNPGILGMDFDLYYDDTVMVLTEATSELDPEECVYTAPAYYRNPTTFLWDSQDLSWTDDGTFLKLHFDILDTAPSGEYEIKIMYSYGNIFGADLEPIDVSVRSGNISVA